MSYGQHQWEMKIQGLDNIGDSKRKKFENYIKCTVQTPAFTSRSPSDAVANHTHGELNVQDVFVKGVCQNKGNLRQAIIGKKIVFEKIEMHHFIKADGSNEEQEIQKVTLENAAFTDLVIDDADNTFQANIAYEKIEIKDITASKDGKVKTPFVTSYNRLESVANS